MPYVNPPSHPGYISGNYCLPQNLTFGAGAAVPTGSIRLVPFQTYAPFTVSQLGCRITTLGALGNLRLGLYAHNRATGNPTGTVLAETGDISTTTAVAVTAALSGANALIVPGTYWAALQVDATAGATVVIQTVTQTNMQTSALVGSTNAATVFDTGTAVRFFKVVTQAYGVFGDLTAASFTETLANTHAIVGWKVA